MQDGNNFKKNIIMLLIDEILIACIASIIGVCVGTGLEILAYWGAVGFNIFFQAIICYDIIRVGNYYKKNYYKRKIYDYQNKIKLWENAGGTVRKIIKMFVIPIVLQIAVVIIYLIIYRNQLDGTLMNNITKLQNIVDQNWLSIVLAAYGVWLTMLSIVCSYVKQKSFLFEVDQNYMVRWSIYGLFISVVILVGMGGAYLFKLEFILNNIWEVLGIVWFGDMIISIFLLLCALIVIYNQKFEKKILRDMHKLFWNEKIVMTPNKIWYKSNMIEGLVDLYLNVIKVSKKLSKDNITSIEFGSVYENNVINNKMAKKKIIIMAIGVFFWQCETFGILLPYIIKNPNISILGIFYWIQVLIWSIYFIFYIYDSDMQVLYLNYFERNLWGYYFIKDNNPIYIHKNRLFKYERYINSIKNVIAFFNLARNMKYEDLENSKAEQYYIDCMIGNVRNIFSNTWNESKKYLMYAVIPIAICGCISDEKSINNRIHELFAELKMHNEEKNFVFNMSLHILRDYVGNDKEYNDKENKYKRRLNYIVLTDN